MAHNHNQEEEKEDLKKNILKIASGCFIFIVAIIVKKAGIQGPLYILLIIASYIVLGSKIILSAIKNLVSGKIFDENFLTSVATLGAFALGDYNECIIVMLLYGIGELAQDLAADKSMDNILSLLEIEPKKAILVTKNGQEKQISPQDIKEGDIILVLPGEKIPVDGVVIKGVSYADTSTITGESLPLELKEGTQVVSLYINTSSPITIKATKSYKNSTVSIIMNLVKESQEHKAPTEKLITKFSKIYTPLVCLTALLYATVFSIITGNHQLYIHRALTFLMVSCPCALVLSIPLAYIAGLGKCANEGILVKGATVLENLAKTTIFAFDKTGTLTKANLVVSKISGDRTLEYCSYLERYSTHPISSAIVRQADEQKIKPKEIKNIVSEPGLGLSGFLDGRKIVCGNEKMLEKNNISFIPALELYGSIIYVAYDNTYIGYIIVSDTVKDNAASTIKELRNLGISKTVMLSGDNKNNAEYIARIVGIDKVHYSLLPQNKVKIIQDLKKTGVVSYAGDGINDAPVLSLADNSFSMGSLGSDAAIQASSIVLTNDNLSKIPFSIKLARQTVSIARQNICLALLCKTVCMILSAFGIGGMILAVFADTGVSFLCILNSARVLKSN